MNTYEYKKLMYPEPEASGGGVVEAGEPAPVETSQEATPAAETETKQESVNLFDVDLEAEDDETTTTTEDTSEQEYDLGDVSDLALDEYEVEILRDAGKSSGVSPEQAKAFMKSMREKLEARIAEVQTSAENEATEQLRKDWGAEFDSRMKDTQSFLRRVAKANGWTKENIAGLQNAGSFRLLDGICRYVNANKSVTTVSAPTHQATREDLSRDYQQLSREYFELYLSGDSKSRAKAYDIADKLWDINKKLNGPNAPAPVATRNMRR